jgi:hypothetical protein
MGATFDSSILSGSTSFFRDLAALLAATTSAVQTIVSGRIGLRRHAGRAMSMIDLAP